MLYGIQRASQERLASEGCTSIVLVAYGSYWYPWFVRRLRSACKFMVHGAQRFRSVEATRTFRFPSDSNRHSPISPPYCIGY